MSKLNSGNPKVPARDSDAFASAISTCARSRPQGSKGDSLADILTPCRTTGSVDIELMRRLARRYTGQPMGMEGFRRIIAAFFCLTHPPDTLAAAPLARLFRAFDSGSHGELTWGQVMYNLSCIHLTAEFPDRLRNSVTGRL